jgi:hypothetical protein
MYVSRSFFLKHARVSAYSLAVERREPWLDLRRLLFAPSLNNPSHSCRYLQALQRVYVCRSSSSTKESLEYLCFWAVERRKSQYKSPRPLLSTFTTFLQFIVWLPKMSKQVVNVCLSLRLPLRKTVTRYLMFPRG